MNVVEFEAIPAPTTTFAGGLKEVRNQLGNVKGGQVLAFVLDTASEGEAKAIEQVISRIIRLTQNTLTARSNETLSSLVETLLPKDMPSPALLKEAKMMLRAKEAVLSGADWLTAAQVASIAGLSEKNPSAQLHKWKRDGAIFAIRRNAVDYFPGYALDPANEYRPYRPLKKVLQQFGESKDGWGLAYWFQSVNSFLGGKRPMEMLAKNPDAVVAAAADEAIGVAHA
jgi:hypothetical protein